MNMSRTLQIISRLISAQGIIFLVKAVISAVFGASRQRRFVVKGAPVLRCDYQIQWSLPTRSRIKSTFYRKLNHVNEDVRRRTSISVSVTEEVPTDNPETAILLAGEMALTDNRVQRFLLAMAESGRLHIVYPDSVGLPEPGLVTVLAGIEANAEGRNCLLRLRQLGIACDWLSASYDVDLEEVPLREACVRQAMPKEAKDELEYTHIRLPSGPVFHQSALSMQRRPLRILTYRWHVPHQYELYKLDAEFTLISDLGEDSCRWWDFGQRPLPDNAHFVKWQEIDEEQFDLAILHFDEHVLDTPLKDAAVGLHWGESFRFLMRHLTIPRVAICHGTPQAADAPYDMEESEANREAFVELLKNTMVVVNSHQAQAEWGFHQSRVIWHGFDPQEFPGREITGQHEQRILTLPRNDFAQRPAYRGVNILEYVANKVTTPFEQLAVPEPNLLLEGDAYARAKFTHYINTLHGFDIYFNPTLHSPMPRTRGESMLCGLATVNLNSHDVDHFINNCVNGFYADSAEELTDQINYLLVNTERSWKIGLAGRRTAIELFHIKRFLGDWRQLIRATLGSSVI
ncbi:glycosyltransferase family 1 protein [Solemya velesiana gill symbiont]|uniref:Glycosyltransferase family 1 protein n=1 Tax=Solemya velesiana gill symbiont TaxID=1918948 RepID=A0A1T2KSA8_9GAMM|nr:glycosyltransferase family 1 protein [Solemya velesiana gill symbiont]OOZ35759.1 hypothetical protein BOW51_10395 [Solemya velesiana gill symbiont]